MTDTNFKNIFIGGAISPDLIAKNIAHHQHKKDIGGHSIFLGQVRADIINAKPVEAIEYTANEPMALSQMHVIREAIFAKYPLTCMHVFHSLGKVNAGQLCLFVFTSSAHRKAAIDACEETVELIKSSLPIWGREIFGDDSHQWKVNI